MRSADVKKEMKVTCIVSRECWKELHKLAIDHDASLGEVLRDVIETAVLKSNSMIREGN